jgi:hypothetical protein
MVAIRLNTTIGEDRKLIIQLPDTIPPGSVELIVRSTESESGVPENPAREAAKAKLLAAGALVTQFNVPEDAVRLSPTERLKMGTLMEGARSSLDFISEDRDAYQASV